MKSANVPVASLLMWCVVIPWVAVLMAIAGNAVKSSYVRGHLWESTIRAP